MANESGDTRRSFLAAGAVGALAAVVPRAAGRDTQGSLDPEFTFDCSAVSVDDWDGATGARVEFRDGSYVQVGRGSPERVGSPGRVVAAVVFTDGDGNERRFANDTDDCDPGPRATTFTSSRATVRAAEFDNVDVTPDGIISRVVLHFVDGTTQTRVNYERDPTLLNVATTYRGTGDHEGRVIEAVEIAYDLDYTTHYLRNPAADKFLLGAGTCQERLVEVVGASEGAVDYEFTVDGSARAVSLTDRRGAGGNDAIDDGDGTTTVTGTTGNPGYSDVYLVTGEMQSFEQTGGPGDYVLRECEWRIREDGAAATDNLAVIATESGELTYEFTVDGTARRIPNAGEKLSAEENDAITDNGDGTTTVSGYTGNEGYGDSFAVTGPVTDFRRTGGDAEFRIEYNGREVTAERLTGD